MLFTGLEVHIEKYLPEVSKMARDRRPMDIFETEGKYFSIYGPTKTVTNFFFFPLPCEYKNLQKIYTVTK